MTDDPRVQAARYRVDKLQRELDGEPEPEPDAAPEADRVRSSPGSSTATDRAAYVETAIQQAIRRGEFDDLPGAGKPLEGLGEQHDPNWWIRRKIQTEKLTGLGPPSLMLRTEHAEFAERADALHREQDVREYVEDFNRRVIEARRQLQGGPPVVTPLRDVDEEVAAWHERRVRRHAAASVADADAAARSRRRWWRRG
ncbi:MULTISPECIES: DUF1992 domain-containing protein [unclassified Microbacterium]|uniref:DnaJ family domain-containing protein n=1 Tax=unclassified Microbacterium TaxID=2609290 RepID=UPI00214C26AC|nr:MULTISPECIES: DUF1992 domain-containing protein [unclassified Microbacterium]MCR2783603.1 DUF1992 domain-containing protein [Microbacterium sp. zg.B96]WIM15538.1 DUF1992 domain-containing protein [Microbacterium sp. zg-B96]